MGKAWYEALYEPTGKWRATYYDGTNHISYEFEEESVRKAKTKASKRFGVTKGNWRDVSYDQFKPPEYVKVSRGNVLTLMGI